MCLLKTGSCSQPVKMKGNQTMSSISSCVTASLHRLSRPDPQQKAERSRKKNIKWMRLIEFHKLHFTTAFEEEPSWDNCSLVGRARMHSTTEGTESGYGQVNTADRITFLPLRLKRLWTYIWSINHSSTCADEILHIYSTYSHGQLHFPWNLKRC